MAITYEIKKLLGGSSDERLEIIEKRTRERLLLILGSDLKEVPPELEYVVLDVSLKRFNRIGQEGMQSYSQEGLSMTFSNLILTSMLMKLNHGENQEKLRAIRR